MLFAACGGEEACTTIDCQVDDSAAPASNAGAPGRTPSGAPGGGTGPGFVDDVGSGGTSGLADGEVCQEVVLTAQTNPVNVLILLDRSTSMLEDADTNAPGVSRWDAVTAALRAFVNSPQAEGARVGLQFFGLNDGADDCSVEKYATPAVGVAPLVDNRAALLAAIDTTLPGSLTPTAPAVSGALSYALSVAQQDLAVPTVMVLASDGIPSECGPMTADGQQIISFAEIIDTLQSYSAPPVDAQGTPTQPGVRTFIVGTQQLASNAESLAAAGNGQAFLVGAGTPGEGLEQRFLDALLSIVVRPLDCELDVPQSAPDGEVVAFDEVRLRFTGAASGSIVEFPRVMGPQACGNDRAWFYEDANPPRKIFLCRQACDGLGAGELKLELGCAPELIVR